MAETNVDNFVEAGAYATGIEASRLLQTMPTEEQAALRAADPEAVNIITKGIKDAKDKKGAYLTSDEITDAIRTATTNEANFPSDPAVRERIIKSLQELSARPTQTGTNPAQPGQTLGAALPASNPDIVDTIHAYTDAMRAPRMSGADLAAAAETLKNVPPKVLQDIRDDLESRQNEFQYLASQPDSKSKLENAAEESVNLAWKHNISDADQQAAANGQAVSEQARPMTHGVVSFMNAMKQYQQNGTVPEATATPSMPAPQQGASTQQPNQPQQAAATPAPQASTAAATPVAPASAPDLSVKFATGSSELTAEAKVALAKTYEEWKKDPTRGLKASGHVDDVGTDAINNPLAKARAQAVATELHRLGVPLDHIVLESHGKNELVENVRGADANNRVTQVAGISAAALAATSAATLASNATHDSPLSGSRRTRQAEERAAAERRARDMKRSEDSTAKRNAKAEETARREMARNNANRQTETAPANDPARPNETTAPAERTAPAAEAPKPVEPVAASPAARTTPEPTTARTPDPVNARPVEAPQPAPANDVTGNRTGGPRLAEPTAPPSGTPGTLPEFLQPVKPASVAAPPVAPEVVTPTAPSAPAPSAPVNVEAAPIEVARAPAAPVVAQTPPPASVRGIDPATPKPKTAAEMTQEERFKHEAELRSEASATGNSDALIKFRQKVLATRPPGAMPDALPPASSTTAAPTPATKTTTPSTAPEVPKTSWLGRTLARAGSGVLGAMGLYGLYEQYERGDINEARTGNIGQQASIAIETTSNTAAAGLGVAGIVSQSARSLAGGMVGRGLMYAADAAEVVHGVSTGNANQVGHGAGSAAGMYLLTEAGFAIGGPVGAAIGAGVGQLGGGYVVEKGMQNAEHYNNMFDANRQRLEPVQKLALLIMSKSDNLHNDSTVKLANTYTGDLARSTTTEQLAQSVGKFSEALAKQLDPLQLTGDSFIDAHRQQERQALLAVFKPQMGDKPPEEFAAEFARELRQQAATFKKEVQDAPAPGAPVTTPATAASDIATPSTSTVPAATTPPASTPATTTPAATPSANDAAPKTVAPAVANASGAFISSRPPGMRGGNIRDLTASQAAAATSGDSASRVNVAPAASATPPNQAAKPNADAPAQQKVAQVVPNPSRPVTSLTA